jgi:hypothetical protein
VRLDGPGISISIAGGASIVVASNDSEATHTWSLEREDSGGIMTKRQVQLRSAIDANRTVSHFTLSFF